MNMPTLAGDLDIRPWLLTDQLPEIQFSPDKKTHDSLSFILKMPLFFKIPLFA
jgi:hypothetical protein